MPRSPSLWTAAALAWTPWAGPAASNGAGERRHGGVVDHGDMPGRGRDLLDKLQPFAADRRFDVDVREPRDVAAWPRERGDKAAADRIGHLREHDRECARFPQQRRHGGRRYPKDDVGLQRDQFLCESSQSVRIVRRPAIVDADIAAVAPVELVKPLAKRREPTLRQNILIGKSRQHGYPAHAASVLRARGERPSRRPAEERHKFPPLHALLLWFWSASYHTALNGVRRASLQIPPGI